MRNKIIVLAAGCLIQAAHAQSGVTLYGIVDTGVEYYTHANAAGDGAARMPSLTGSTPSRWGIRSTEDLGGGVQVFFVLENGFATSNGTINNGSNRIFGRQANVGISGKFGTLTFGRQMNMTMYSLYDADVIGASIHSMGSIDSYIPNARSDNAIGYMGTFYGLTIGATYSFGRDASNAGGPAATNCAGQVPGDSSACRQWTAMLKYDASWFGIATAYDRMNGGAGASGGLSMSSYTDTRTSANGYFKVGQLKIGGGWIGRQENAATSLKTNLFYLGFHYPFTPALVLDSQALYFSNRTADTHATLVVARFSYLLSKVTAIYTSLAYVQNSNMSAIPISAAGSVGTGMNQAGAMIGIRHSF